MSLHPQTSVRQRKPMPGLSRDSLFGGPGTMHVSCQAIVVLCGAHVCQGVRKALCCDFPVTLCRASATTIRQGRHDTRSMGRFRQKWLRVANMNANFDRKKLWQEGTVAGLESTPARTSSTCSSLSGPPRQPPAKGFGDRPRPQLKSRPSRAIELSILSACPIRRS